MGTILTANDGSSAYVISVLPDWLEVRILYIYAKYLFINSIPLKLNIFKRLSL